MERAVFLLRQVFELEHAEIAAALGIGEAAARQTFHRAKERVAQEKPRFAPSREAHERILLAFATACQAGDVASLRKLLAEDAVGTTDGGGKVRAARNVLRGADPVARFFVGITAKSWNQGFVPEMRDVNGWPALLLRRGAELAAVLAIETDGERVYSVQTVSNPEKLGQF
jgi:RNA polymerase sigma-70 factor (ECF subfamily)